MWANDAVNAVNLLKLTVYKKLNSNYDENTALYIHSLMTEQVACHYMMHLVILMKKKAIVLLKRQWAHKQDDVIKSLKVND